VAAARTLCNPDAGLQHLLLVVEVVVLLLLLLLNHPNGQRHIDLNQATWPHTHHITPGITHTAEQLLLLLLWHWQSRWLLCWLLRCWARLGCQFDHLL
jgi:hypothetical protein